MLRMVCICLGLFLGTAGYAQQADSTSRRPVSKQELKTLAAYVDSLLLHLQQLYAQEVAANSPGKYQPERIATVRSYLLVFQTLESSSAIVAYKTSDVKTIFGKPDSILVLQNQPRKEEWIYASLQKKYVRLSNLKYHFVFQNGALVSVRRE
ncbi:MAG: hypothetical protein MUE96_00155 [Bacteroidia bacterium]|nr:hypothetical protein [Bacteroidia bacterium]